MHLIRPFAALRPTPDRAAEVVAPPYDVVSIDEARQRAAGKPWSFLHISRPEIDLPADTDPHAPEVYARGAANLRNMFREGILRRDAQAGFYVYRVLMGEHVQTGLVLTACVADYESNRIRRHELTRPDKEDDRVRQIETLNAQTGPALLAYPDAPEVDALLLEASDPIPEADVTADDGVRHTVWSIRDAGRIARLTAAFDAMPALYIADGHHRIAAAARVAAARRAAAASRTGEESHEYFLAVAFPHQQLRILDYNRVVADLNGLDAQAFIQRVESSYAVQPAAQPVKPAQHGEVGMYLRNQWYRLRIKPDLARADDPVKRLDVSLLSEHLLGPVLDIHDLRLDQRIDFVGGIRGLEDLQRRVDSGAMAVAFALYPTSLSDLMQVADAGQIMPPKSTWFEPKLADGLVSHVLD